jgi:hypothetical protein
LAVTVRADIAFDDLNSLVTNSENALGCALVARASLAHAASDGANANPALTINTENFQFIFYPDGSYLSILFCNEFNTATTLLPNW